MTPERKGFGARHYRSFGIYEDRDQYGGQVQDGGEFAHVPVAAPRGPPFAEAHMPSRLMITLPSEVGNEHGRPPR